MKKQSLWNLLNMGPWADEWSALAANGASSRPELMNYPCPQTRAEIARVERKYDSLDAQDSKEAFDQLNWGPRQARRHRGPCAR